MTSVLSDFLSISLPFSEGDAGKHTECEMVWDAVSSRAFGPQGLLDLYFSLPPEHQQFSRTSIQLYTYKKGSFDWAGFPPWVQSNFNARIDLK